MMRHSTTMGSRATAAAAVALLTALVTLGLPDVAGATGGGAGASGSGDTIISWILSGAGSGGRRSSGSGGAPPVCTWHTLTDRQVLFLLHVAADMEGLLDAAFLQSIDRYLAQQLITAPPPPAAPLPSAPPSTAPPPAAPPSTTAPPLPSAELLDIQVRICDGMPQTDQVRTVATTILPGSFEAVARDSLTRVDRKDRLDPPRLVMTPRIVRPAIVGEPVFVSLVPDQHGLRLERSLPAWGRVVLVRARPSNLSVFSGQPSDVGRMEDCNGFGTPYDPDGAHPHVQAGKTCAIWYDDATGGSRRSRWIGYAELSWLGEYSIDGGVTWSAIDGLFSFTTFQRQVDEVDSAIEDRPS